MATKANDNSDIDVNTYFNLCKECIPINYKESMLVDKFNHAAHCMIYAKWNTIRQYNRRAAVLMQLRFDGQIGFPGGQIDRGENPVEAVNRELFEELNFDLSKHRITEHNRLISHVNHRTRLMTHFFAFEVKLDEFELIEKRCLDAEDFGRGSLGVLRACLYTMDDNIRGFPTFLRNNFVGHCKEQLCQGLLLCDIMTVKEIKNALKLSANVETLNKKI